MCVFVRSNNAKLCAHAHTHLSSGDALCARACACVCIRVHTAATTKTLHCHRLCGVLVCGSFTKTLSLDWWIVFTSVSVCMCKCRTPYAYIFCSFTFFFYRNSHLQNNGNKRIVDNISMLHSGETAWRHWSCTRSWMRAVMLHRWISMCARARACVCVDILFFVSGVKHLQIPRNYI